MKQQKDHDQQFKTLIFRFFFEFIELFFPELAKNIDKAVFEPVDKEIFARKKRRKAFPDLAIKTRIKMQKHWS